MGLLCTHKCDGADPCSFITRIDDIILEQYSISFWSCSGGDNAGYIGKEVVHFYLCQVIETIIGFLNTDNDYLHV